MVFGVYYAGEEHYDFLKKAHNLFFSENALNPMAFKSLKQFESEVVQMTCSMLNGPENAVGTMTSGGTESILMAVKAYRDRARKKKPWIFASGNGDSLNLARGLLQSRPLLRHQNQGHSLWR